MLPRISARYLHRLVLLTSNYSRGKQLFPSILSTLSMSLFKCFLDYFFHLWLEIDRYGSTFFPFFAASKSCPKITFISSCGIFKNVFLNYSLSSKVTTSSTIACIVTSERSLMNDMSTIFIHSSLNSDFLVATSSNSSGVFPLNSTTELVLFLSSFLRLSLLYIPVVPI